jgi:hypothetical protein
MGYSGFREWPGHTYVGRGFPSYPRAHVFRFDADNRAMFWKTWGFAWALSVSHVH